MRTIFISVSFLLMLACSSSQKVIQAKFVGEWRLVATIEKENSHGRFENVDSNKKISIQSNGTVVSNGNLCQLSTETVKSMHGKLTKDGKYYVLSGCRFNHKIWYSLEDGDLVVYYSCLGQCVERYERVNKTAYNKE